MKTEQEEDRVAGPEVLGVMGAIVVIIAFGVGIAWLIMDCAGEPVDAPQVATRGEHAAAVDRAQVPPHLFEIAPTAAERAARAERQLERYGWVDQDAGVVHLPIERAMQLHVEQHRAAADTGENGP